MEAVGLLLDVGELPVDRKPLLCLRLGGGCLRTIGSPQLGCGHKQHDRLQDSCHRSCGESGRHPSLAAVHKLRVPIEVAHGLQKEVAIRARNAIGVVADTLREHPSPFGETLCQAPSTRPVSEFRRQAKHREARSALSDDRSPTRTDRISASPRLLPWNSRTTLEKRDCFMNVPPGCSAKQHCPTTQASVRDRQQGVVRPNRGAPSLGPCIWVRLGAPARQVQLPACLRRGGQAGARELSMFGGEGGEEVYGLVSRGRFAALNAAILDATTAHEDDPT